MLTLIFPSRTWLHRIPAGIKLAVLPVVSAALFWVDSLPATLAACAVVAGLVLSCGPDFSRTALRALRPLVFFVAVVLAWGWYDGRPAQGILIAGRMLALVGLAQLLTMTTRFDDIMVILTRLLRHIPGIDAARLAFASVLVIRFTPTIADKGRLLAEAWRARSRRRPGWQIVMPWVIVALDDAQQVSDAIRARGGLPTDDNRRAEPRD